MTISERDLNIHRLCQQKMIKDVAAELSMNPNTVGKINRETEEKLRSKERMAYLKSLSRRAGFYPRGEPTSPYVTYAHQNSPSSTRFRQLKTDPLPEWAVDVRDSE